MKNNNLTTAEFNEKVAAYFDVDAADFEDRYQKNHILQRIRRCFRNETEKLEWQEALEIGCGPGIDLAYFADRYPERRLTGLDISPKMIELAKKNIRDFPNAEAVTSTVENIPQLFNQKKFDLVYCYFGALNTVRDLQQTGRIMQQITTPKAEMILTFINRYYLTDIVLNLIFLRPRRALGRVRQQWLGYSPKKQLASTPRGKKEVETAFSPFFKLEKYTSYSLIHPAWYRAHLLPERSRLNAALWQIDELLRRTALRN